jgi:hypothetical protein
VNVLSSDTKTNTHILNTKIYSLLVVVLLTAISTAPHVAYAQSVTRARISGDFSGWNGTTIVRLDNGQIWQQAEYYYEYHYAYAPKVILITRDDKTTLQVEGTRKSIRVQLLVDTASDATSASPLPPTEAERQDAGSSAVDSTVVGMFTGWTGSTIVKLANGQIWQQAEPHIEITALAMPRAVVYRSGTATIMFIEGADEPVRVKLLAGVPIVGTASAVESRIEGDFEGWDGETLFMLDNGQIWEQAAYSYAYHYAYRPKVLIYPIDGRWEMQVAGMTRSVQVRRLR